MRRVVTAAIAMLGVVGMLATSAPAGATDYDDPFFLNWPEFLPSTTTDYTVSESNECKNGQVQCVDNVIREMTKRYNRLECDHDSTFAFTYLLTTEEYRRAVEDPEFFSDNAFVNHQDAVFADYYFDQFDAFHRGDLEKVSPAWRIAFQSAEDQKVSGMGNVFLGMNAHVNRDLPMVLAEIGLVKPDGTSRKPDHDRVNDFLAAPVPAGRGGQVPRPDAGRWGHPWHQRRQLRDGPGARHLAGTGLAQRGAHRGRSRRGQPSPGDRGHRDPGGHRGAHHS